jgi:hypothetical protein
MLESVTLNFPFGIKKCFRASIPKPDYVASLKFAQDAACTKKDAGTFNSGIIGNHRAPFVGKLGEFALSYLIKQHVDLVILDKGGHDTGCDFETNGIKIDVKTNKKLNNAAFVVKTNERGGEVPLTSDVFVVAYLEEENEDAQTATVILVGWFLKSDLNESLVKPGRFGNQINYEIPYSLTKDMDGLKDHLAVPPKKRELIPLSASKIKTFENCSWMYWVNYHLKFPQTKNDGSRKGDVCHQTFELLINREKHGHIVEKVVKAATITAHKPLERLVRRYAKETGLEDNYENFHHLDEMIICGLNADFYVKGGVLLGAEFKFDFVDSQNRFHLKGFIDKPFIVGKRMVIDDYKSSKKKFEGEEEESNVQALIYSYSCAKLFPHLEPEVRFIFLQFPDDPIMRLKFSPEALTGFEGYLEMIQKKVENFELKNAYDHFAADHNPPKGEFKGKLLCGFASFPGELKKDGKIKWVCPYKFPRDYFSVKKEGEILYSSFEKETIKLKPGEVIEKLHYGGCPRHANRLGDMPAAPVVAQRITSQRFDPLEDF